MPGVTKHSSLNSIQKNKNLFAPPPPYKILLKDQQWKGEGEISIFNLAENYQKL